MGGHKFAAWFFGSVICLWLVVMIVVMRVSALPDEASGKMLVVFEPGTTEAQAVGVISTARGKILRDAGSKLIWIVTSEEPGFAGRLRTNGALGVYRDLPLNETLAGCFAIADAKVVSAFQ